MYSTEVLSSKDAKKLYDFHSKTYKLKKKKIQSCLTVTTFSHIKELTEGFGLKGALKESF